MEFGRMALNLLSASSDQWVPKNPYSGERPCHALLSLPSQPRPRSPSPRLHQPLPTPVASAAGGTPVSAATRALVATSVSVVVLAPAAVASPETAVG